MPARPKIALLLTGGGARAAYQIGVLKALCELLPGQRRSPFQIYCGTSAGAINTVALASWAEDFPAGVEHLGRIWESFHAGQVYRADPIGILRSGAGWLWALMFGWITHRAPRSLLDNSPLCDLLNRSIDFDRIRQSIASGVLHAVSVTCSGYTSGQSVTFFEGRADILPWRRSKRMGTYARLGVEHLLASSAIPFIFPAVRINREWFGDGSMRQMAPIAPAIHLGAERILVVGAGRMQDEQIRQRSKAYPSLAQIAGHVLSSIFLDSLPVDIERATRINHTLSLIPESGDGREETTLRPVSLLVISPSERLDQLAAQHAHALPRTFRILLRGIGAMNRRGGALISYLLFEQSYTRALIEMGYRDTLARREEVIDFLDPERGQGLYLR